MKKEKKRKHGINTIKGAILEIVISAVAILAVLAFFYWFVKISPPSSRAVQEIIPFVIFSLVIGLVYLLDGIITIPYLIKKRRREKESEDFVDDEQDGKLDE